MKGPWPRSEAPELMDLPDSDTRKLLRTVRQFRLINALLTGSRKLIRRHLFSVMERDRKRPYTLLDIGAGGCDIAAWAAEEADRRGIRLDITALDNDERILPLARETAGRRPSVRVARGDARDLSALGEFDFIFSNHFFHHLGWEDIAAVLGQVLKSARLGFVINDLKRSRAACAFYTIFAGLFLHDSFAFHDGRLSIKKGFLPGELERFLASRFPGAGVRVLETSPFRVFLHREGRAPA